MGCAIKVWFVESLNCLKRMGDKNVSSGAIVWKALLSSGYLFDCLSRFKLLLLTCRMISFYQYQSYCYSFSRYIKFLTYLSITELEFSFI